VTNDRGLRPTEVIIILAFLVLVITDTLIVMSGVVWVILDTQVVEFWVILLTCLGIALDAVMLTYSLVRYSQESHFRELVLFLITVNMIIAGALYMLTNAASFDWSPFADRDRNRTVIATMGFILTPMPLLGSFTSDTPASRRERTAVLLYGGLIIPLMAFWFLLSPQPVFSAKPIGGTLADIPAPAMIVLFGVWGAGAASAAKLAWAWRSKRDGVDLAFSLSSVLWIMASLFITVQTNPLQAMEILFMVTVEAGIFLLALAMTIAAIVEPHKELRALVAQRTKQLDESRMESEYYLNIWSHKVGNLLQGVVTYLELTESALTDKKQEPLLTSAMSLAREMELINRQVGVLARLKGEKGPIIRPLSVSQLVSSAIDSARSFLGADSFVIENLDSLGAERIRGSDVIEQAIVNLLAYLTRDSAGQVAHITVHSSTSRDNIDLAFSCHGTELPHDMTESLFGRLDPTKTTLSLDLFSVKILMEMHGGSLLYSYVAESSQNRFVLRFRAA
jgi:hypothetical protein